MRKRRSSRTITALLLSVVPIGLAGCKPDRAVRSGALLGKGVKPPGTDEEMPGSTGSISGFIRLKGSAPQPVKLTMSADEICELAGGVNLSEQIVSRSGGLGNVYVYVKDGPAEAMKAEAPVQQPVVFEQSGCRYVPHVAAVMRGGVVEFRNSDGTRHTLRTLSVHNAAVNLTQAAKGAPRQQIFDQPEEMMPVRCGLHSWEAGYLNVSATPFFAISSPEGHFEISGLPPGEYTLAAVHEKLGEQTIRLTVASKKQTPAEFSYTAK